MKKSNYKKFISFLLLPYFFFAPITLKVENNFTKTGSNWLSETLGRPNQEGSGVFSLDSGSVWFREKIKVIIKEKFSLLSGDRINVFLETLEIDYENLYLSSVLGSSEKLTNKMLFEVLNGKDKELKVFVKLKQVFSSDQKTTESSKEFRLPIILRRETTYSNFQEVEIRLHKNFDEISQQTAFINNFNFWEVAFFLKKQKIWDSYTLFLGEKERSKVKLKTFLAKGINVEKEELPSIFIKKGSKFILLGEDNFKEFFNDNNQKTKQLFFCWTWDESTKLNYIPIKVEYIFE